MLLEPKAVPISTGSSRPSIKTSPAEEARDRTPCGAHVPSVRQDTVVNEHRKASRYRMTFAIDVAASPEQAFELIGDITRHDEWSPQEFEARRLDEGPIGVGTRYRTAGRKGVRPRIMRETEVVVTAYGRPTTFAFEAREEAGTYRTAFRITANPDGGSQIVRTVDPPGTGLVPFIRHRLLAPAARRYVQRNMEALRERLDRVD